MLITLILVLKSGPYFGRLVSPSKVFRLQKNGVCRLKKLFFFGFSVGAGLSGGAGPDVAGLCDGAGFDGAGLSDGALIAFRSPVLFFVCIFSSTFLTSFDLFTRSSEMSDLSTGSLGCLVLLLFFQKFKL